jgi:hypothetical protein
MHVVLLLAVVLLLLLLLLLLLAVVLLLLAPQPLLPGRTHPGARHNLLLHRRPLVL